jgi:hypothetical protein
MLKALYDAGEVRLQEMLIIGFDNLPTVIVICHLKTVTDLPAYEIG